MAFWGDLNARARGLSNHLLGRGRLEALATAATVEQLATMMAAFDPRVPRESDGLAQHLDLHFRRVAADRLATIARWSGPRLSMLAVLFEDEDRRSIRALVRGALQGAVAERRLAGLIPTRSLPLRGLDALARCQTVGHLARLLRTWRSPYGEILLPEAEKHQPDPLALELAVNAKFAERARTAAKRGDRYLRQFVRTVVDLENAAAAAVLAERGGDAAPVRFFLQGGGAVSVDVFRVAAVQGSAWRSTFRAAFSGTALASVFTEDKASTAMESNGLRAQLAQAMRFALLDPLSSAPLIAFVLRSRAELVDIRSLVWGLLLGAETHRLHEELVTPW
jgi:vacuolar-type H+-ATPase subunit C/Vma6